MSPRSSATADLNETAASVLGFLSIGPLTGWDLNALAQVSVGHFWNMTRSQIYRELAVLQELSLVEVEASGPRNAQRFRLTASGKQRLHEWLVEPPRAPVERNPFLVKLFFADQMTAKERRALLHEASAWHKEQVATLREALTMAEQLSPYAAATATYGIAVHQAILRWFDELSV